VCVAPSASARLDTLRAAVHAFITASYDTLALPSLLVGWDADPRLAAVVQRVRACETPGAPAPLPLARAALQVHVYQPNDADGFEDFASGGSGGEGDEVLAASMLELPSSLLDGLWDSLIFPDDTKQRLLDYIYATVLFSDADVDCALSSVPLVRCMAEVLGS
jgi:hypothetical protein